MVSSKTCFVSLGLSRNLKKQEFFYDCIEITASYGTFILSMCLFRGTTTFDDAWVIAQKLQNNTLDCFISTNHSNHLVIENVSQ